MKQGTSFIWRRSAWLLALACCTALAGEAETRIQAAINTHTKGKVTVDTVRPTPVAGMYEVTTGMDVFYVDATGRWAFIDGRLVDMITAKDWTQARIEQLTRIDWKRLPLHLAIKEVRGTGQRHLAVFEDPSCAVCRSMHKFLAQLPDVTIYRFMYPIADPGSMAKTQAAWCSRDRAGAWAALMNGGTLPQQPACDVTALKAVFQVADQLKISGTPTVFLADGRRLVGATPPDQFIAALDALPGRNP